MPSIEEARTVAKIILEQMGGIRALALMTSASTFTSHADEGRGAVSFKFKGSRKANYVKIVLTGMDDYTVRFFKLGTRKVEVVREFEGIYCDTLIDCFRNFTGLELLVPRIVFA